MLNFGYIISKKLLILCFSMPPRHPGMSMPPRPPPFMQGGPPMGGPGPGPGPMPMSVPSKPLFPSAVQVRDV